MRHLILCALFICTSLMSFAQEKPKSPEEAWLSQKLMYGQYLALNGKLDSAISLFTQTVDSSKIVFGENHVAYFKSMMQLGVAHRLNKNIPMSIQYQKAALFGYQGLAESFPLQKALICQNIGNNYGYVQHFDSAMYFFEMALQFGKEFNPKGDTSLLETYLGIGSIARRKVQYDLARRYYEEALDICNQYPNIHPRKPAVFYKYIAEIYAFQIRMAEAREYLQKALSLELQVLPENHPNLAATYNSLGSSYQYTSNFELAENYYQKALAIYSSQRPINPDAIYPMKGLAELYVAQGDSEKSLPFFESAVSLTIQHYGRLYTLLGEIYQAYSMVMRYRGKFDKSRIYADSSLLIFERVYGFHHPKVATAYGLLSNQFYDRKEFLLGAKYLHKGIFSMVPSFQDTSLLSFPDLEKDRFLPYYREYSMVLKGKLDNLYQHFLQTGEVDFLESSYQHVKHMEGILEKWETTTNREEDVINISSYFSDLASFGTYIAHNMYLKSRQAGSVQYVYDAFRFMDMSKSRALSQSIQNDQTKSSLGLPKALLEEEEKLRLTIAQLEKDLALLSPSQKDQTAISIRKDIFDTQKQLDELEVDISKKYPKYAIKQAGYSPLELSSIQKKLSEISDSAAVLTFQVGSSITYIGSITPDKFDIWQVPYTFSDTKLIQSLRTAIQDKNQVLQEAVSQELYQKIWHPLDTSWFQKNDPEIKQLIIIPDGILNYLPFEVLLSEKNEYLLEKYDISYALSANIFVHQMDLKRPQREEKLLALAPIFSQGQKGNNRSMSATREFFRDMGSIDQDGLKEIMGKDSLFSYLPNSKSEVEGIAKSFQDKGLETEVFLNSQAQEEVLKADNIAAFTHIHLATHGFSNDLKPQLSGIALYPQLDSLSDGLLFGPEAYFLNLEADLVTLSACETGLGRLVRGEGVLGISRAFIYAGAKNVMMSLWAVEDKSTATLMENFYKKMLDGKSKTQALRQAKLELMRDPLTAAPFYWAPFVLIGS